MIIKGILRREVMKMLMKRFGRTGKQRNDDREEPWKRQSVQRSEEENE